MTSIYILPSRLSKQYLKTLKNAAEKKGLDIRNDYSDNIAVVVTELDSRQAVLKALDVAKSESRFVKLKWLTDSIKNASAADFSDEYIVRNSSEPLPADAPLIPDYECQRKTPRGHPNRRFVRALEILERHAEFRDSSVESDYSRALAFRRAICVLKAMPRDILYIDEIKTVKHIGQHSLAVIKDILENGFSAEADGIEDSEYFKAMSVFTEIFGVGPKTANRWFDAGWRTMDDVKKGIESIRKERNSSRVLVGIEYYDDTIHPVGFEEAREIEAFIRQASERLLPGVRMELVGGFRRGKPEGHDVDLLFTHPEKGKERTLLTELLGVLEQRGMLVYGEHDAASQHDWTAATKSNLHNSMDQHERWIGLLRWPPPQDDESSPTKKRKGTATVRRVDLIVAPIDEFAFALLGWTGSKQFNRSIRLYSERELHMKLTSHGLFSHEKKSRVTASSEEDIFRHLGLEYLSPEERNC